MSQTFTADVVTRGRRVMAPLPFDPDDVWGQRPQHHVAGTVNGRSVRAVVETLDDGWGILLGPAWRRDCGIAPGDSVMVTLAPEGPQLDDLADDLRAALGAEPAANEFWLTLAQFYRRSYIRWIEATKRRPDVRAERIAAVVGWLKDGVKQRPGS